MKDSDSTKTGVATFNPAYRKHVVTDSSASASPADSSASPAIANPIRVKDVKDMGKLGFAATRTRAE